MITLKHLRVVEAIARHGTVTEAAASLYVTQPAVSHSLRSLEEHLGTELFVRERTRMNPTAEGERLIQAARRVLAEVAAAEDDVARLASGMSGVIRIATECYTSYHWLPDVLRRFHEELGHEDVDVIPLASDDPVCALESEAIDVAILHTPTNRAGIELQEIFRDELVLVMPPDHPLAARELVTPEDLRDQRVLHHASPEESLVVRKFLAPAGVEPQRSLELRLTEALISGVKAGMGLATLATWAVAPEVEKGELVTVRLGPEGIRRSWYAAIRATDRGRPALDALVALLERSSLKGLVRAA